MKRGTPQINVGVPLDLQAILRARAERAGHTLSEEVRKCLWAGLAGKEASEEWQREVAITNEAWASQ